MNIQSLMSVFTVVVGYYCVVLVYVLGIQMHLSVPRMTEKFIITDQQRWKMALLQFCVAGVVPFFVEQTAIVAAVLIALVCSLCLFAVMEVYSLVSPSSIILQTVGLLAPTLVPNVVGYCIAAVAFALSIDSKESAVYIRRYDRRVIRLLFRCEKRFGGYFQSHPRFIADVARSIVVVEILCRPYVFRLLERIAKVTFYRSRPMSTGVMQVTAEKLLSDAESIELGIKYVKKLNKRYLKQGYKVDDLRAEKIASAYNGDDQYGVYTMPIYHYVRYGVFPD